MLNSLIIKGFTEIFQISDVVVSQHHEIIPVFSVVFFIDKFSKWCVNAIYYKSEVGIFHQLLKVNS